MPTTIADVKKAVELKGLNSLAAIESQGLVDFINGDYQKAVDSWEKAIQQDSSAKQLLQRWIDKAKAAGTKTL
jgi:lipopolysaccharide biosynthesis regulator YciM